MVGATGKESPVGSHECGASPEEHIAGVIAGLSAVGAGGRCAGTYRALLEVAEFLRREHGHAPYTPTGEPVRQMEMLAKAKAQAIAPGKGN